jgi:hypothetical protein
METETESEMEEDTHPRRRNTIVATGPPAGVRFAARPLQESTSAESKPRSQTLVLRHLLKIARARLK